MLARYTSRAVLFHPIEPFAQVRVARRVLPGASSSRPSYLRLCASHLPRSKRPKSMNSRATWTTLVRFDMKPSSQSIQNRPQCPLMIMKTWTFSCVMTLSTACVPVDQVYAAIRRDESTNLVQQLFTLRLVIHFHCLHLSGCLLYSLSLIREAATGMPVCLMMPFRTTPPAPAPRRESESSSMSCSRAHRTKMN